MCLTLTTSAVEGLAEAPGLFANGARGHTSQLKQLTCDDSCLPALAFVSKSSAATLALFSVPAQVQAMAIFVVLDTQGLNGQASHSPPRCTKRKSMRRCCTSVTMVRAAHTCRRQRASASEAAQMPGQISGAHSQHNGKAAGHKGLSQWTWPANNALKC